MTTAVRRCRKVVDLSQAGNPQVGGASDELRTTKVYGESEHFYLSQGYNGDRYTVTHKGTGYMLTGARVIAQGLRLMEALGVAEGERWSFTDANDGGHINWARVREIVTEVTR